MDKRVVSLVLTGLPGSPLVIHAFAEKAKQEIRDKQQKKAKTAKAQRDPAAECQAAKYVDGSGRECAPITAVKKAFVSAATAMENLTKVALRQALFVQPTVDAASMYVPIEKKDGTPAVGVMREDAVTIGIATRGTQLPPGVCRLEAARRGRVQRTAHQQGPSASHWPRPLDGASEFAKADLKRVLHSGGADSASRKTAARAGMSGEAHEGPIAVCQGAVDGHARRADAHRRRGGGVGEHGDRVVLRPVPGWRAHLRPL